VADSLVGKGDKHVPDRGCYVKIETVSVIYRIQGVCIGSFKAIWTAKFVQFDEMSAI